MYILFVIVYCVKDGKTEVEDKESKNEWHDINPTIELKNLCDLMNVNDKEDKF